MKYVEIYLNEILDKVQPYLRGNGGPIIMVQVRKRYFRCQYFTMNNYYFNRNDTSFGEEHIINISSTISSFVAFSFSKKENILSSNVFKKDR